MLKKIFNSKYVIIVSTLIIVYFGIVAVYPLIFNIVTSFKKTNFLTEDKFVGLYNYKTMINDDVFWIALRNNFIYLASIIIVGLFLSLIIANLIYYSGERLRKFFTAIYFLPVVTSLIAVSMVWTMIYLPNIGILSSLLYKWFNIGPLTFLSDPKLSLGSIILMDIWRTLGFNIVIIVAGINEIPSTIFDAAEIDGVNPISRFFKIILPLIRPQIVFLIAIRSITSTLVFEQIYMMSTPVLGAPSNSTWTLVSYMFNVSFKDFRFGYGTTIAFFVTIILLGMVIGQLKAFQLKYEDK